MTRSGRIDKVHRLPTPAILTLFACISEPSKKLA
jgi:hypothetical protein